MNGCLRIAMALLLTFILSFKAGAQNQTVITGTATAPVNFTSAGCRYNWTNNNPNIGLPASGIGNIASFTALNNGTTPITATITGTPVAAGYAYILNEVDDNVSAIDLATNTIKAKIPVGETPVGEVITPDGSKVYIANLTSQTVSVINTANNTVTATIPLVDFTTGAGYIATDQDYVPVTGHPVGIAISPDGKSVFVANSGVAYSIKNSNGGVTSAYIIYVIDTATGAVGMISLGRNPSGLCFNRDGTMLYVSDYSNTISVINVKQSNPVHPIVISGGSDPLVSTGFADVVTTIVEPPSNTFDGHPSPYMMALTPDGSKVYVTNINGFTVSAINTATNTLISTINVGQFPGGISVSQDGSKVYVACNGSNLVDVISTLTNSIIQTYNSLNSPSVLSLSLDGKLLYVNGSSDIAIIDLSSTVNRPIGDIGLDGTANNNGGQVGNFIAPGSCSGSPVTFTITVNPSPSPGDATLSALSISSGALSPAFVPTATTYTDNVSNATAAVLLRPTANNSAATITVNGVAVPSGSLSGNINLDVGANVIPVVVTSADGTVTQTYTVTVTRANTSTSFAATNTVTYGAPDFDPGAIAPTAITYSSNNLAVATIVSGKIHIVGAGTSTITATAGSASLTQLLTVTPALLTITANNQTKVYGASNPALTVNYSGFVNGDTPKALTKAPVLTTTATVGSGAGTYPITVSGAVAANYNITYIPGILTVTLAVTGAPNINYTNPATYTVGATITPLSPTNTGGTVPATIYGLTTTLAGSSTGIAGRNDGTGSAASFNVPLDVKTDQNGNVYVADQENFLVRKITPGGVVTTLAGSGIRGSADGTGAAASFSNMESIAVDLSGNVYIADNGTQSIRKITPGGVVTTLAGSGHAGYADGTGTAAVFNGPNGVTVDASGTVFVVDGGNVRIRKITPNGVVTTFAGNGLAQTTDGTGTAASFNGPADITADAQGNLYVPEYFGNTIRKITPAGVVTTLAGSGAKGSANGSGTSASFNGLTGIGIDPAGNLYVAGEDNLIRKITQTGVVTTFAGNGMAGFVNGVGTSSSFRGGDVGADNFGNVYIADAGNNVIRKIVATGYSISPTLPAGLVFDGATGTISGTPTIISPATTYTISAYNNGGSSTTTTTIATTSANDAYLASLAVGKGKLSPGFVGVTNNYTDTVSNATTAITITPTANNATAAVKVNGTLVSSGTASASLPLAVGNTTINIVVTAADGVTKKAYIVVVTRVSNNAYLSNLTVSTGTLSPAFTQTNGNYAVSVSNATTSITVTPTLNNPHATIKVNGTLLASGATSAPVALAVGNTTINVVVTAQDGVTKKTYAVVVTRVSNNPYLSNLTVSSGVLSPVFSQITSNYTVSVSNATASVMVTPTLNNPHGSIKVNGTTVTSGIASTAISLNVGANTISTVVTAQDGVTHKTYTITVTKASGGMNSLYLPGSAEQTPLVSLLNETVKANNILSPNGDGINDIWVVKNIAFYPNNTVTVYDRSGKMVFTKKGYANDWDGSYRGSVLNEGTYYYLVDLGNGKNVKGFINVVAH